MIVFISSSSSVAVIEGAQRPVARLAIALGRMPLSVNN
jgi:hypothetical protein